jgi:serine/threonine-protein kinase
MRLPRAALASFTCAALFAAAPVRADPAAAEALFEEGVQLAERGQLLSACQKFEASEGLDVAVGTLLFLADCYERTGRLASAWSRFREAASLAHSQAMPDRERIATVRADALAPRMARVTVRVSAEPPPGIVVELGHQPVPKASWGSALPVDSGKLLLEASAPGYAPFRREITIADGARVDVPLPQLEALTGGESTPQQVTLRPVRPEAPRSSVKTTHAVDRGYAARVTGATLAVWGGLGLAAGGVLTALAATRNDKSRDYCPESERLCTQRGVELRHEAQKLADSATISLAVGGGLLAAGLVVYWAAPRGATERVSLLLAPDAHGGVSCSARGVF